MKQLTHLDTVDVTLYAKPQPQTKAPPPPAAQLRRPSSRPRLGPIGLLVPMLAAWGCVFAFDRAVSPGEIRLRVLVAVPPKRMGKPRPVISASLTPGGQNILLYLSQEPAQLDE